jgi:beta-galactosidase
MAHHTYHLGTQYYRPPFPNRQWWAEDFARIRAAGLNTVQLWVVWAWVEADPGQFNFADYDELVALAQQHELQVVLSVIAELQPYWIHRLVPSSELVNHLGMKIESRNRIECHFGLTPGGCTDHPDIWVHMRRFMSRTVEHFRAVPNLLGWDAWNELRWNAHAEGLVCFCPHTLRRYRTWLQERHGDLAGLNAAWQRRYVDWADVLPGKTPGMPYTELMAFQEFMCWRANDHGRQRYELMKALDPERPVTIHGGNPCTVMPSEYYPDMRSGVYNATALYRGNDWDYADVIDGIGTSSFPHWKGIDIVGFNTRVEYIHSAARGRRVWLSELQGGSGPAAGNGPGPCVDAEAQQRWIWSGIAGGAETILFWCWRDETFGVETGYYGFDGADGQASIRHAAMQRTAGLLQEHADLLEQYTPVAPEVGVLFSPQSYFREWAEFGSLKGSINALETYCRSLTRLAVPYRVVEERHLELLSGLKLLFLPRVHTLDDAAVSTLLAFVRQGGWLVCESETAAFGSDGIYRYPGQRALFKAAGVHEIGRRSVNGESFPLVFAGQTHHLTPSRWLTPLQPAIGAAADAELAWLHAEGALLVSKRIGHGGISFLGTQFDQQKPSDDFDAFVLQWAQQVGVVRAVYPATVTGSYPVVKIGHAGGRKLMFVFSDQPTEQIELVGSAQWLTTGRWRELFTGQVLQAITSSAETTKLEIPATPYGVALLVGEN